MRLNIWTTVNPLRQGLVAFGDGVIDVPFDRIISEPDNFTESELFRIGYNLEHQINDTWQLRHAFEHSDRDLFNIGVLPLEFDETTGIITRFPAQQKLITQNSSMQTNVVGEFATGTIDHTLLAGFDWNSTLDSEFTGFDFFTPSFLDIFNPVYGLADFDGNALPTFRDTNIKINRIGVYLQDQVEFSDNFFHLAGVRYDTIEQTTTNNPIPFLDPFGSETTQEDDAFTPRFGIVYKPVDFLSLYGSYSQSFTPNIGTTSAGDALAPEEGEGFEVGIKAELLEDNLFATLSYFDITRQNVATSDPLDPFASVATGEQRSQGIELDVVGELLPGWNVIASYAYTDARVTDDNDVPEGNGLVNIPENSASLWTTYEIQSGDLEGLGFGIGFNFVGERPGNLGGFEETFELDDYFLTNAGIFYRRDNWRFALNAKNLFDVDYVAASNNSRTSGIETGAPLTLVGSISVKF
ncbi:MAG: TonB-dependent siderophore receptor [Cyanobacteria bacterium P01_D01_bin.56]